MNCPKCNRENPADAQFCQGCGVKLELTCTACGTVNGLEANFCKRCGARLTGASPAAVSAAPKEAAGRPSAATAVQLHAPIPGELPEGERKMVTALFADIKGSTELMEDLDPEEARAIVDPALALMIDAVHRYGGYIVQSTGDGIFALFGAPIAHEDHPQRALYAALRMQEDIRRYGDKLREQGGAPVEIRVGVNSGEVVVRSISTGEGHAEYTPIGHTTNLASRMQAIARSGSIVASEHTQRLAEGYFQTKALGPVQIKGLTQPVNVFEVAGLGPLRTRLQVSARRGLSRFVGRGAEMEALRNAAAQAKTGQGRIVAAVGEPGVGKSRLFYEFKAIARSEFLVLETFSVSHGKASAYLPVIELLKNYFEIAASDDDRKRREKVTGKVLTLDRLLEEILPEIFSILAIAEGGPDLAQPTLPNLTDPGARRRTPDAAARLLLRESLNQPLLVILEDLHWIDAESQAFVDLLADSVGAARILLLVNYRPEYGNQWSRRTGCSELRLEPLAEENADELLGSLLGESEDLAALRRFIIGRTEGNPFFIEEMVAALFDQGVLARDGAVKQVRALTEIKIPATVQGVLASRIDRLATQDKELLQTLAAIGKQFPLPLVEAVAAKPRHELDGLLGALQQGEFIYEQPAFPDVEYTFKHALTQEVAYNSMLTERRRSLHRRAGDGIESLYSPRLEDHYDELAHHYSRCTDSAKAALYLSLAGRQALGRAAWEEARNYAGKGLEFVGQLDGSERTAREPELLTLLAFAVMVTKGPGADETAAAWSRAREVSRQAGATSALVQALSGLSSVHAFRGEVLKSRQVAEEALELAQQSRDPARLTLAWQALGPTHTMAGNLSRARQSLEREIALLEASTHTADRLPSAFLSFPQMRGTAFQFLSRVLWLLGFPDQARRSVREAIDAYQGLGLSAAQVALIRACDVYILRGEQQPVRENLETVSAITDSELGPVWSGWRSFIKGWALAAQGQVGARITMMQDEIAKQLTRGPKVLLTFHSSLLAQACAKAGRIDDGIAVVEEALRFVEASGERFCQTELLRLQGDLALMRDASNTAEAERCFREAIEIARGQEARSWELRATTSLARLLRKQGRIDEARAMLAEIYNWFTEGFDTADLKEARALLQELGA